MTDPSVYTTAFGASLDLEIGTALAAGMPIEAIYAELSARTREVAAAVIAKHERREDEKCGA